MTYDHAFNHFFDTRQEAVDWIASHPAPWDWVLSEGHDNACRVWDGDDAGCTCSPQFAVRAPGAIRDIIADAETSMRKRLN